MHPLKARDAAAGLYARSKSRQVKQPLGIIQREVYTLHGAAEGLQVADEAPPTARVAVGLTGHVKQPLRFGLTAPLTGNVNANGAIVPVVKDGDVAAPKRARVSPPTDL
jgi:hypothetical protein